MPNVEIFRPQTNLSHFFSLTKSDPNCDFWDFSYALIHWLIWKLPNFAIEHDVFLIQTKENISKKRNYTHGAASQQIERNLRYIVAKD